MGHAPILKAMQCTLCPKSVVPEDASASHLEKWEQVEVHTFRGGALLLLVGNVCPTCVKSLVPGSVALSFTQVQETP